jgi:threonine aldolase
MPQQQFASDNNAGMCPEALEAFLAANAEGHTVGYGDDGWTAKACDLIRALFERDCAVFFVFNGTAANALALAQLCKPWHSVIAHAESHIETDEAGAPGFLAGGAKIATAATPLAKLTPAIVETLAGQGRGVHSVRPRVLSLTQATEMGTVYTPDELAALTAVARRHGLAVHMDGARFANAVAALGCSPADLSWRAGVDVLCLGGVKNGLAAGEAVVFFDKEQAREFEWRVKQAGHLNSKMRLVTAPWVALLESGAWLRNARHANAMARRLWERIAAVPGVAAMAPVESNAVFAALDVAVQERLRARGWRFYAWGEGGCRLMCAWDTTPETVDRFALDLAEQGSDPSRKRLD